MRDNPRDWLIKELKALADHFEIGYDQTGSHVTFRRSAGAQTH
jgi:hypothetical protein